MQTLTTEEMIKNNLSDIIASYRNQYVTDSTPTVSIKEMLTDEEFGPKILKELQAYFP